MGQYFAGFPRFPSHRCAAGPSPERGAGVRVRLWVYPGVHALFVAKVVLCWCLWRAKPDTSPIFW